MKAQPRVKKLSPGATVRDGRDTDRTIHFATDMFVRNFISGSLRLRYRRINESSATVYNTMTFRTERNQVFRGVVIQSAPRLKVMNLEIFRAPALLTSPAIPTKNLLVKLRVGHRIQAHTRTPDAQIAHRAAPSCSMNRGLSSAGKS